MKHPSAAEMSMSLGWEFNEVLSGHFERDRAKLKGRKFPIIGPLPDQGKDTKPIKNKLAKGPYIYAVYSSGGEIMYVGKADEDTVLYRWIRPDRFNKSKYYWAHGTTSANLEKKSTIEKISKLISENCESVSLQFSSYSVFIPLVRNRLENHGHDSSILESMNAMDFIKELEHCMIFNLQPKWNIQGKKKQPSTVVSKYGAYWQI